MSADYALHGESKLRAAKWAVEFMNLIHSSKSIEKYEIVIHKSRLKIKIIRISCIIINNELWYSCDETHLYLCKYQQTFELKQYQLFAFAVGKNEKICDF